MAFTDEEKVLIRKHLGYPSLDRRTGLALGTAGTTELRFILESAMEKMPPASEESVRLYLQDLECIDQKRRDFLDSLELTQTGDTKFRGPEAFAELDLQYMTRRNQLGDMFDVPADPFSQETQRLDSGAGVIEPH